MEYNLGKEIMSYIHYAFTSYYFIACIVLINTIKVILAFVHIKNDDITGCLKKHSLFDILTSILAGTAELFGLIFTGILTDIYNDFWFKKIFIISLISLILFLIQVIFYLLVRSEIKKKTEWYVGTNKKVDF